MRKAPEGTYPWREFVRCKFDLAKLAESGKEVLIHHDRLPDQLLKLVPNYMAGDEAVSAHIFRKPDETLELLRSNDKLTIKFKRRAPASDGVECLTYDLVKVDGL